MKKTLSIIFGVSVLFFATGCEKKEEAKITYKLTTEQVYDQMCVKCHGKNGEGNPKKKAPALNDQTIQELRLGITDIKMGGSGVNSSGTQHEVMEHNMKKIIEKGMDYDTDLMAQYIHDHFNKN
ncbi:MAG: c-type cytochrome [Sulfurovaceae bacterium]|nr:c-type cytochrome [Sulfurovaceae bacterium]MDD5548549.1 c-type cytochrome [Sulfurovaceae bacterium]